MTTQEVHITITPAHGGFIVRYPTYVGDQLVYTSEVATTIGKAMRVVKRVATEFSLVQPSKDDE